MVIREIHGVILEGDARAVKYYVCLYCEDLSSVPSVQICFI